MMLRPRTFSFTQLNRALAQTYRDRAWSALAGDDRGYARRAAREARRLERARRVA